MQQPGQLNLVMYQGATWDYTFTWEVEGDDGYGPIDVTGYAARLQARSSITAPTATITLSDGSGITLGGATGTIAIAMAADDTSAIPAGRYVYDLELESQDESVTRLLEGQLNVRPEITRPVDTP
jgi:hypothetical protein